MTELIHNITYKNIKKDFYIKITQLIKGMRDRYKYKLYMEGNIQHKFYLENNKKKVIQKLINFCEIKKYDYYLICKEDHNTLFDRLLLRSYKNGKCNKYCIDIHEIHNKKYIMMYIIEDNTTIGYNYINEFIINICKYFDEYKMFRDRYGDIYDYFNIPQNKYKLQQPSNVLYKLQPSSNVQYIFNNINNLPDKDKVNILQYIYKLLITKKSIIILYENGILFELATLLKSRDVKILVPTLQIMFTILNSVNKTKINNKFPNLLECIKNNVNKIYNIYKKINITYYKNPELFSGYIVQLFI